jgi:hypothetical protein
VISNLFRRFCSASMGLLPSSPCKKNQEKPKRASVVLCGSLLREEELELEESPCARANADRLKPIRPKLDCGTIGLGSLLVRTQDLQSAVGWVKLEPPLARSIKSLFAANPHDVNGVAICELVSMFSDKHGFDLADGDVPSLFWVS